MFIDSYDLEIVKEGEVYFITYKNKKIKCALGKNYIHHNSKSFLEYLIDDLDRSSEIKLNKNNSIDFGYRMGAYAIFTDQLSTMKNETGIEETIKFFSNNIYKDLALVQTANGPPYEIDQAGRLTPVRNAISNLIGKELFSELTEYGWGNLYVSDYGGSDKLNYEGPGKYIEEKDFKKTKIFKNFYDFFKTLHVFKLGAVQALLNSVLERRSILLPLALVNNLITKREFLMGFMGLGNNIMLKIEKDKDSKGAYHELYDAAENAASVALEYCKNSETNSIDKLLDDESIDKEFKSSLSLDFKKYRYQKDYKVLKEGEIEMSVLKTICAFLNTKGGNLLIGIDDDKNKIGINEELRLFHKSKKDNFLKYFQDKIIISGLGNYATQFIDYQIMTENSLDKPIVLSVVCKKSDKLIYVFNKEAYVRKGPSNRQLTGQELSDHILKNYKK